MSLAGGALGVHAGLTAQLQQQLGFKASIDAEKQHSVKLTLSNKSEYNYRLYALWHVENRIAVDTLSLSLNSAKAADTLQSLFLDAQFKLTEHPRLLGSRSIWTSVQNVEFRTDSGPHITYADVDRT